MRQTWNCSITTQGQSGQVPGERGASEGTALEKTIQGKDIPTSPTSATLSESQAFSYCVCCKCFLIVTFKKSKALCNPIVITWEHRSRLQISRTVCISSWARLCYQLSKEVNQLISLYLSFLCKNSDNNHACENMALDKVMKGMYLALYWGLFVSDGCGWWCVSATLRGKIPKCLLKFVPVVFVHYKENIGYISCLQGGHSALNLNRPSKEQLQHREVKTHPQGSHVAPG